MQCGVGEQTQEMYCVETGANGDTVYVSEDLCERYSEKHPVYKRACEGDGEECPYWATTAWTEVPTPGYLVRGMSLLGHHRLDTGTYTWLSS